MKWAFSGVLCGLKESCRRRAFVEIYEELSRFIEQDDNCEEKYKYCIILHDKI